MASPRIVQWSGPLLILGGVLWAASAIIHARQPLGCIADECLLPGRSMREGTPLGAAVMIASLLVLAAGIAGLVIQARATGRFSQLGSVGLAVLAIAIIAIILLGLVQAAFFGGDFPAMPYFLIPASLAVIVGCALLGVAILRSGVLPRWAAILLVIGTVVLLGMNEQNSRVLLLVPFGVAWAVIGGVLLLSPQGDMHAPGYPAANGHQSSG